MGVTIREYRPEDLPIIKAITVEAFGGSISCQSEVGEYLEFEIALTRDRGVEPAS